MTMTIGKVMQSTPRKDKKNERILTTVLLKDSLFLF